MLEADKIYFFVGYCKKISACTASGLTLHIKLLFIVVFLLCVLALQYLVYLSEP